MIEDRHRQKLDRANAIVALARQIEGLQKDLMIVRDGRIPLHQILQDIRCDFSPQTVQKIQQLIVTDLELKLDQLVKSFREV